MNICASVSLSSLGSQRLHIDTLHILKQNVPVLRHIPKAARNLAANQLCSLINRSLESNSLDDWCSLLTFSYRSLRVPVESGEGNLTQKVKANLISENFPFSYEPFIRRKFCGRRGIEKYIESKVYEGDLGGAVRLLVSDESLADASAETLSSLRLKHPSPSRTLSFPDAPDNSTQRLVVKSEEVAQALLSFRTGSAAGLDGVRPGHLKELISSSAGDSGMRLLESLTRLVNFLLGGELNPDVCPYLYGGSLCALNKREGGVRPIAVGSVFRRLTAKIACHSVREKMTEYLQPQQLGFGTPLGCEAAIHATRAFALDPTNCNKLIIKLDLKNAFNTLERDVMLREVKENIPAIYPFLYQAYSAPTKLYYGDTLIPSLVGAQQGDPLGPLIFSLSIKKVISDLKSPLNIWYLDDGTIGGMPEQVEGDLLSLIPRFSEFGLSLNSTKCQLYSCGPGTHQLVSRFNAILPGLTELTAETFTLLGSPIFTEGVPAAVDQRRELLLAAQARLNNLTPHVALVLLRMCFAVPRITYLLRTAPTWLFPVEISNFDNVLKMSVETLLNVSLNEAQWDQAALPIRHGGLGIRRARDVGLPAFLASANGVADLVTCILSPNCDRMDIPFASDACEAWSVCNPGAELPKFLNRQRLWDDVGAKRLRDQLIEGATGVDVARLKGVSTPESGAWLHALPSPHLGTLLDGDSLCVAVALRLGCNVCETHTCTCGSIVAANGHHALSCFRCSGRFARHHALNDIIRRALVSANVPCLLEPPGLIRTDGKRPDGLTLLPWLRGKCLVWDATCVSTFAVSHLGRTTRAAAAAAEVAAESKRAKYAPLLRDYFFVPFAVEVTGCWGSEAKMLVKDIGRRLRDLGRDYRSGWFLTQRIAIAIQRGNASCILGSFAPGMMTGGLFD